MAGGKQQRSRQGSGNSQSQSQQTQKTADKQPSSDEGQNDVTNTSQNNTGEGNSTGAQSGDTGGSVQDGSGDENLTTHENKSEETELRNPASVGAQGAALDNIGGGSTDEQVEVAREYQSGSSRPVAEPLNSDILKQGEPLRLKGEEVNGFLLIKRDLYREVIPFRSKRPTYVLIYTAGTMIPLGTIQRIDEESKSNDNDS